MYHYKIIITTQTNIMSNVIENKVMLLTPSLRQSPFMNSEEANIYIAMLEKTLNNVKMLEMKTDEAKIQLRKRETEVDTIKLNLRYIMPKKRKTNDYDTSIEKMTEAAINVRMTELKATGAIAAANSAITEIENLLVMKAETEAGTKERAEVEAETNDEEENETIASLANKWKKTQAEEKARAETEAKAREEAEAKAREEAEAKAREEAEAKAREEAEAKAREEAEIKARAEAEAKEKAEVKAREEAEAKSSVEAEANTRAKKKARVEAEVKARAEAKARAIEVRTSLAKAWTEANARDEAIRKNNETVVDNEIEMSTTPFPSAYKCDELYIEEKRKRLIERYISRYRQNPSYKDLWKINLNLVKEFIDKNKTSPKGEFAKWISNQTTNFITNKNMMEDTEIKELWKNFIENYN